MKIDIWSDIVCPFCYIGKRHLEQALADFPGREQVEIEWHSFELDPQSPEEPQPVLETLMKKYRQSRPQAEAMMHQVMAMGMQAGLELKLLDQMRANSFRAHCTLKLAAEHGLQTAAKERLLRAYFTEGENINEPETLVHLLEEIGLSRNEILAAFDNPTYAQQVRDDERQASELGISGVPFFVFDGQYAISGAQPVGMFKQVLASVTATESTAVADEENCSDNSCAPGEQSRS